MNQILLRQDLAPKIHLFKVAAPKVAQKAQAGQFVIVRIDERGERIPLTIANWDRKEGSVTVVFMEVGTTTRRLAQLGAGDSITDFVGPLGLPTHIEKFGTVVCVAGGFAIATIMPIARAMRQAGNRVISIMGARSKNLVFWEEELGQVSDQLIVTTDDGSYGRKGLVTEPLRELLSGDGKISRVIAIGPSVMMKFCAKTTEPFGVKTIVSLNNFCGQAELWDTIGQHATSDMQCLKDGNTVPQLGKVGGSGKSRRPGADHSYPLACRFR